MASDAIEANMAKPVTQKFARYHPARHQDGQNSNDGPIHVQPLPSIPSSSPPQILGVARSMSRYHRKSPSKPEALPTDFQVQSSTNIDPNRAASLAALTGEPCFVMQSCLHTDEGMESVDRPRPGQVHRSHRNPSRSLESLSRRTSQMTISYGDAKQQVHNSLRSQRSQAQEDALRRMRKEEAEQKQLGLARTEERNQSTAILDGGKAQAEVQTHLRNRSKRSLNIDRSVEKGQAIAARIPPPAVPEPRDGATPYTQSDDMAGNTLKSPRHNMSLSDGSFQKRQLVIGAPNSPKPVQVDRVQSSSLSKLASLMKPAAELPKAQAFDAPISAVNAGERRVLVKCNNSSITLPVNPTTKAQDLLNSASVVMSEAIDPRKAVLVESFKKLSLDRPLRRYEHVRDVMNSWDNDEQNVFVIIPLSERPQVLLEMKGVPRGKPEDVSFNVSHSQKPGKWKKCFIKLRADGQMVASAKEGDCEATNICHLSDFDIYEPTQKQQRKIKCPKKICFAIKSQQKSSIFLDSAAMNFVHFVATNDQELGAEFYLAVQSWRSSYLCNELGEGQKHQARPANVIQAMQRPSTATSAQSIPYRLGSFEPLFSPSPGQPKLDADEVGIPKTQVLHKRNMSCRDRKLPPSAFPNHPVDNGSPTVREQVPNITGRTGSITSNVNQPSDLVRTASLRHSKSMRQNAKPLIDHIPQIKEAPQRTRISRSVGAASSHALVELAADAEGERSATANPSGQSPHAGGMWPGQNDRRDEQAFTGTGLLGRAFSKRTQVASRSGRDAKDLDGQPLIDLSLNSKFAEGSLLRQVEVRNGDDERGLVIDREKRVERSMKVGEGY